MAVGRHILVVKTPASLLDRLKRPDDQDAWARFVRLYAPMIYRWAHRAGLEENDASDLTQDVLVTLVQTLPRFSYDRQRSFRAWLKTVTLNRWREITRRHVSRPHQRIVEDLPDEDGSDVAGIFEQAEYNRHVARRAMTLIRQDFEPTTWKVWWEYVVVDRPAAEVADRFGVSVNAVYLTKSRVLRRLREELDGLLD